MKNLLPAAILLLVLSACGGKENTIKAEKRNLTEVVYASGNLYPVDEYKVISSVPGYISEIFKKEGDSLRIGDEIILISTPNRNSESSAASVALKVAINNSAENGPVLSQIKQRLIAAQKRASTDSLNLARYTRLAAVGAIAQADLDKAATQAESSMREALALADQLQAQKVALEAELANARNRFNQAGNNLSDGLLKSKLNGTLYQLLKQEGDFVNINEPIALIGSASNPVARLSIDESDFELIKTGQEVQIAIDAYPGKLFKARITRIYPVLNKTEQAFKADATFTDENPDLIYGLNLEANVIIRTGKDVLTIPRSALMAGDSVIVVREGKKQKIKVKTGITDLVNVEIVDGLNENEEVISSN
ncbi:MAG: efflux RND transporter periplasmic adaptor subunit [Bacteroidia bacterium]